MAPLPSTARTFTSSRPLRMRERRGGSATTAHTHTISPAGASEMAQSLVRSS